MPVQAREPARRPRVPQTELQPAPTQLTQMPDHGAAQHGLATQAQAADGLAARGAQIGGNGIDPLGMGVQPRRNRFQHGPDGMVNGIGIE